VSSALHRPPRGATIRPMTRILIRAVLSVCPLLGSATAYGQDTRQPPRAPAGAQFNGPQIPLPADVVKRIRSGDPAQTKSALDDVRTSGRAGGAAAPVIIELLRQGTSPALTQAAIETLGDVENEAASDVLGWYARHRSVEVRRSAVEALAKTRGPMAVKALRSALSDSDAIVRGFAATALGSTKAKDSVPDLFAALDHKVPEASAAIGELCSDNDCERLAAKLGSMPFDIVTSGLEEALLRPASEVGDTTKIDIVERVRGIATAEANRFLKGVQKRWPARGSQRVKQAIDQAVTATAGSPGSRGTEVSP